MLRIGNAQHKIQIETHYSENTNWKIQIGQIQFRGIQTGKYNLRNTNRKIQSGKYKSGNVIREIQNGKYKPGNTNRKIGGKQRTNTIRKKTTRNIKNKIGTY